MSIPLAAAISVLLLVANAFFVAAEFAVVAAKRHRLEDLAAQGSGPARIALKNNRELSLMLAGAQLGITLCTLGLGAVAKPAVAALFENLFGLVGMASTAATVVSIILGVAVVVFLHMVVGEMAPKSWAISSPERSATLMAWPFRAFVIATGPVLRALNALANACLRAAKVTPVDELANVHGPQELRMLLESSAEHDLIPAGQHRLLSGALGLQETPVYAATLPLADAIGVPANAHTDEVERVSSASGRSRLVVVDSTGTPTGIVHIRDALKAPPGSSVGDIARETLILGEHENLLDAVTRMREARAQLAFVAREDRVVGLTTLEDLLERVLGEFDDETDDRDGR